MQNSPGYPGSGRYEISDCMAGYFRMIVESYFKIAADGLFLGVVAILEP